MPLTYSDVMSRTPYLQSAKLIPYTGYNAILYARWLPVAVLVPILAAMGIILSLFLPWFSIRTLPLGNATVTVGAATGFQIASNGAQRSFVGDTFSFPLLWSLVFLGVALIVFAALLFRNKVLTPSLSLLIPLSFGLALLVELVCWITISLKGHIHLSDTASLQLAEASYGLWICLLVTLIGGGVSLILFSNLSWYWRLALEDIEQVAKKTNLRPIFEEQQNEIAL